MIELWLNHLMCAETGELRGQKWIVQDVYVVTVLMGDFTDLVGAHLSYSCLSQTFD